MDQRDFKPSRTSRLFVVLLATIVATVFWGEETSAPQRVAAPMTDATAQSPLR